MTCIWNILCYPQNIAHAIFPRIYELITRSSNPPIWSDALLPDVVYRHSQDTGKGEIMIIIIIAIVMVIAVVVCQWSLEKCCTKSHGKTAIVVFKIELFQRIHSSLGTPILSASCHVCAAMRRQPFQRTLTTMKSKKIMMNVECQWIEKLNSLFSQMTSGNLKVAILPATKAVGYTE